jgi:hypothetical protein
VNSARVSSLSTRRPLAVGSLRVILPRWAAAPRKLHELRPVSFHLKSDPKGAVQYGLIAEEVNQVFPELVIRDEAGTIQGVRYDELAPMLLNEVQQQAAEIRDLKQQVAELNDLKLEMRAALVALKSKDELVARR